MPKKSSTPVKSTNAKKSTTPTKQSVATKAVKKGMGTRGTKAKPERAEKKIGLTFPVGRIDTQMKHMRLADRTGRSGAVFMAAVLEYLTNELLEVAGQEALAKGRKRITPADIQKGICGDAEMQQMFANINISDGGYRSQEGQRSLVHQVLFPAKKGKKAAEDNTQQV